MRVGPSRRRPSARRQVPTADGSARHHVLAEDSPPAHRIPSRRQRIACAVERRRGGDPPVEQPGDRMIGVRLVGAGRSGSDRETEDPSGPARTRRRTPRGAAPPHVPDEDEPLNAGNRRRCGRRLRRRSRTPGGSTGTDRGPPTRPGPCRREPDPPTRRQSQVTFGRVPSISRIRSASRAVSSWRSTAAVGSSMRLLRWWGSATLS